MNDTLAITAITLVFVALALLAVAEYSLAADHPIRRIIQALKWTWSIGWGFFFYFMVFTILWYGLKPTAHRWLLTAADWFKPTPVKTEPAPKQVSFFGEEGEPVPVSTPIPVRRAIPLSSKDTKRATPVDLRK